MVTCQTFLFYRTPSTNSWSLPQENCVQPRNLWSTRQRKWPRWRPRSPPPGANASSLCPPTRPWPPLSKETFLLLERQSELETVARNLSEGMGNLTDTEQGLASEVVILCLIMRNCLWRSRRGISLSKHVIILWY